MITKNVKFNANPIVTRPGLNNFIVKESYNVVNADQSLREIPIPDIQPTLPLPKFGFVENAERINGRLAMIFFIAIFIVEAIAGQGILELLGIQTGKGIDIGF